MRAQSLLAGLLLTPALTMSLLVPAGSAWGQAVTAARSGDDAVNHVVVISVDGLNRNAIRELGRENAPAFYRMLDYGAGTFNARTLRERTRTLPNHTGMLTGRRVRLPGGHGVNFNHDNGTTVHAAAGERVASMFTVVHNRGRHTAFYSAKDKFAFLNRSWNRRWGRRDRVGINNGRDKIDRYVRADEDRLVDTLTARLRENPDALSFLHLAQPDAAGHKHGFMGEEYVASVRRTDRHLGRVLRTIVRRRSLKRHTVVILTADHGGRGANHSDPARRANYSVPFLVWGATIARGVSLYGLNGARRRNPGPARTSYAGKQPIRNAEAANLATDLLDMRAVPGSQLNPRQGLRVAR